jgi:hypothetical protein
MWRIVLRGEWQRTVMFGLDSSSSSFSSSSSTVPRWLLPPEVLQSAGLLCEPGFGSFCFISQVPLCLQRSERPLVRNGELWARNILWILSSNGEFRAIWRDFLHTANLRHGTDGFTFPPKEGMLRFFASWKKSDSFGRVRTRELGYHSWFSVVSII